MPRTRASERKATADMIACLAEVDRRRLYLAEACSSLQAFCVQRLGYSENEAQKRIQVARLYRRLPQVLSELENGSVHLTGLFLLSAHLTADNASALPAEARGRTRREIEGVVARWFPRSDVLPSITPLPSPAHRYIGRHSRECRDELRRQRACANAAARHQSHVSSPSRPRAIALNSRRARRYETRSSRLEIFSRTRSLPGDLAQFFERALDALLSEEVKRRLGAGKPRRRRALKEGSRHVPVEVARTVWERDGFQCTFVDAQGRRCDERRFLTIEHREPFARGGPSTVDNLCLLCSSHNALRAREEFGAAHIEAKRLEALAHEKTLSALMGLGFERRQAKSALEALRRRGEKPEVEALLRGALAVLVT